MALNKKSGGGGGNIMCGGWRDNIVCFVCVSVCVCVWGGGGCGVNS